MGCRKHKCVIVVNVVYRRFSQCTGGVIDRASFVEWWYTVNKKLLHCAAQKATLPV